METVTRRDCDERHDSDDKLLDSKLESVLKDVAAVEVRIKVWVMAGLFMFLFGLGGTLVCIGVYKEKVDKLETRVEQVEQQQSPRVYHPQWGNEGRSP